MSWRTCPDCGADGYILRPDHLGWAARCPGCSRVLAKGPTKTDCVMQYTRISRVIA